MARAIDGTKATKEVMEYSRKLHEAGNVDAAGYVMWAASIVDKQPTIDPLKNGYVLSGVLDQVRWERDVAIEQLNSYGIQLGEKAELEIVKHGKWVENHGTWYCSECGKSGYKGYIPAKPSDYCPNCGARMRGEKE